MSSSVVPPTVTAVEAMAAVEDAVGVVAGLDPTSVSPVELGRLMRRLDAQRDRLAGVAGVWAGCFEAAGGPDDDGAPTLSAWMRRELRVTATEARRRVRAGHALKALPGFAAALADGTVGAAHVDVVAHGVHTLGAEVVAGVEPVLLEVARTCDADLLKQALAKVRDTLDPDAADAAYIRALERRDVTVTGVGDGFVVRGFVGPETGVALREVLYSLGKPAGADDDRPAGHRRADGLGDLCRSVMDHGLPTDRGLRPHLYVTVTADRLATATTGQDPADGTEPARLHGHGDLPDHVLARIACDATLTPVTLDQAGHVLDVGRSTRLATLKQRHAIAVQQDGTCLNPGCHNTRLEIHHIRPWSTGGPTDLANLAGYCTRCHHLIHQGLLDRHTRRHRGLEPPDQAPTTPPSAQTPSRSLHPHLPHALLQGGKHHARTVIGDYRRARDPVDRR